MYHYFYKITNNINGKFYYGIHNTSNLNDNYILVSGNVPGAKQSLVLIKSAAKNERKAENNELVSYETVVDSIANDDTEAKEENQEN